jgi:DNA polymerase (family 10)
VRRASSRWLYAGLQDTAEAVVDQLTDEPAVHRVAPAGAYRRHRPLVQGLTLVAVAEDPEAALDAFTTLDPTATVEARSARRATIELPRGLPIELVVAEQPAYGAAHLAHTGSDEHLQALRRVADERGLTLTETGLRDDEGRQLPADEETAIYDELDLPTIDPELREGTGEVDAAPTDELPGLVTLDDIRGDLQMHTEYSDGARTVEAMARKADDLGYDYILLTDHGPSLTVANAPSLEQLAEQGDEIDQVNADDAIQARVLHGVEANVTADGMDVPEATAQELDLVVASQHDHVDDATERVLQVIEEHTVDVLGHPTNRRLTERPGNDLDMERIIEAARAHDVAIEINAQVDRLDLDWADVRRFKGEVDFVVSTDAHSPRGMQQMRYGVHQARKGWLEPDDVLNAQPLDELLERLGR